VWLFVEKQVWRIVGRRPRRTSTSRCNRRLMSCYAQFTPPHKTRQNSPVFVVSRVPVWRSYNSLIVSCPSVWLHFLAPPRWTFAFHECFHVSSSAVTEGCLPCGRQRRRNGGVARPRNVEPRGREYLFAPAIFSHIFARCSLNFHFLSLCCLHTIKTSHSVGTTGKIMS